MLLGETAYASLRDIPEPVDMVDVFRPARDAPAIVTTQSRSAPNRVDAARDPQDNAAATAERAGIEVIMNAARRSNSAGWAGELSWSGVNSGLSATGRRAANRPPRQGAALALAQHDLRVRDPRRPRRGGRPTR